MAIILNLHDMTRNSPEQGSPSSSLSSFFSRQNNLMPGLEAVSFILDLPCPLCLVLINTVQFEEKLTDNKRQKNLISLLSRDEQEILASYSFPKRQREWLGGRLATKYAVLLLRGKTISPDRFSAISISPKSNGAPELLCSDTSAPLPAISISHSGDYAVGMAAYATTCGVDIQKITSQTQKVASRFAEQNEIDQLDKKLPDLNKAERLSLLWSTKEALKKALLEDQPVIFQGITLQDLDINTLISLKLQFPEDDSRPAEVKATLLDDYILAFIVNQHHA